MKHESMNYTNELANLVCTMQTALTAEEIKKAYHEAVKKCHPDNITAEADIDLLTSLYETMKDNIEKLSNPFEYAKRKTEGQPKPKQVKREFKTVAELLNSGEEMIPVIDGTIKHVSKVLSGKAPTPNKRQITDKHHADAYGNFDGMRTYQYATVILKKNYSYNEEVIAEIRSEAVIKLMENEGKATVKKLTGEEPENDYCSLPVAVKLWISCRQAMRNYYYKNVEKPIYRQVERGKDIFDLEAYQTKVSDFWQTAGTAVNRVYIEQLTRSPFERKVLALREYGLTEEEIAKYFQVGTTTVHDCIERIHNRLLCDRMTNHLDSLEAIRTANGNRKNASEAVILRSLVMRSIRSGMTYSRIGYHLHYSDYQTADGKTVTVREQITALLAK